MSATPVSAVASNRPGRAGWELGDRSAEFVEREARAEDKQNCVESDALPRDEENSDDGDEERIVR